ncbi:hypothetical protein [Streptomyces sp. NPDC049879]|uniref:hypothetical protein n=1 Tax=Streptomyces sp. NPDC049879 TaxID=3365598 RepID=UPI0037961062
MHARKRDLAALKTSLGIKHADAVALLDHPDVGERQALTGYLATYTTIRTYQDAVACLRRQQHAPPGGGDRAVWVPGDYYDSMDEEDPYGMGCYECGAGVGGDPYGTCVCEEAA